ncbi:MAG: ferritin [Chitinophagales bacterium]|nr:ferritin [Chitinophagales bacterium]
MISKKMEKALNQQLILESAASFNYLAMASWCDKEGMDGAAKFFYNHAAEENEHMMKIFLFINEVGGHSVTPSVKQPTLHFKSVLEICQLALKHEEKVTRSIHKMVDLTVQEKDHVTYDFLRFFVREQREEEVLFDKVISQIKLIGTGGQSLYYVDNMLGSIESTMEEEATSEE